MAESNTLTPGTSLDNYGDISSELATHMHLNTTNESSLNIQHKYGSILNGLSEQGWCYLLDMLTHPISIGSTLLAVQYVPRETLETTDEEKSPHSRSHLTKNPPYNRPMYQLAPLDTDIYGTLKALVKQPTEGWFSLGKGQFVSWLHGACFQLLQAGLQGMINSYFNLYDDSVPFWQHKHPSPYIVAKVASKIISGCLQAPLDMAQTRLIVQTSYRDEAKYKGLIHCLRTMVSEEGFGALYRLPILFSTAIIESMSVIECYEILLRQPAQGKEALLKCFTVMLGYAAVFYLVVLPMHTIRNRLQCQIAPIAARESFKTVVRTCPVPYTGILDCGKRILTEESVIPHKRGNSLNWRGLWINIGLPAKAFIWGIGSCPAIYCLALMAKEAKRKA
ncbi:hypothetical protein K7432_010771 [Basidiobolus ranarum]|uniref:Mitochondrial carrier protein n=1 Tax=Basidiobolus ranarum TaxID=34480 RepID=A0ABR2VV20_9FUNG